VRLKISRLAAKVWRFAKDTSFSRGERTALALTSVVSTLPVLITSFTKFLKKERRRPLIL
jgi:hypothetical protein